MRADTTPSLPRLRPWILIFTGRILLAIGGWLGLCGVRLVAGRWPDDDPPLGI